MFSLFALPVYAAHRIPGTVPQLQPLQPIPVEVAPNVQHNVQTAPIPLWPVNSEQLPQKRQPTETIQTPQTQPDANHAIQWYWFIAIGVVVVAIGGWIVYRIKKNHTT